jgi:uncharacterized protein YbjT (DUF2867 family)
MAAKPTVLIVGATGMMGSKIASAILNKGAMNVKALVRSDSPSKALEPLTEKGVTLVEGDLFDTSSLFKALEGVDIVVTSVRGGRTETDEKEIVLTGQLNLIEAAKATGLQRFIPSDFAIDYFKLDLGDNYNLDFRKQIADALIASGIPHTFVLIGAFTEVVFSPFLKIFDFQAETFSYWGDGETLFDATTTDDTAKYLAEAIADPKMVNRPLKIAGDTLSMNQLYATYEAVTGKTLKKKNLGSVEDLKTWIDTTKQKATSHYEYLSEQYIYAMVSGKGKLDSLDNDRYPHIQPTRVKQFVQQM